jgi:hypothetical protein
MSLSVLHLAMLWGLLGVAIPVIIHFLNRRRATVVDWGAMQFLELGHRAQRRFQITEMLLLIGRMLLLGLVALALARPFWTANEAAAATASATSNERRDVALILDGSASMDRKGDGTTPRIQALKWIREFIKRLGPGDSVALLVANDRVRLILDPPSFDRARIEASLKEIPPSRGSSDLPSALAESLRILEKSQNPTRDVVILTDGQRVAWRPGETQRWALLRELHARLPVKPRIWSVALNANAASEGADGAVGPLELSRGLVSPAMPITVSTTITNAGPGSMTRTADLLVDNVVEPGSSRVVGPIPSGGKTSAFFPVSIISPGSHVVSVRLVPGDDPLPGNDQADRPIEVTSALPVLLVDGEPGAEPLSSESAFVRAALAPTGDDTPQVKTTVIEHARGWNAGALEDQKVLVLANVDSLRPEQVAAVANFLGNGGGVLIAPGDRTNATLANELLFQGGQGWLPARLGEPKGDLARREVVAHPAPRSFDGPALIPFGQSDDAPLREADLFSYRVLEPTNRPPAAAVTARLDTGDPWIVERQFRKGRVILLAGPIDAEGGTLPVNPDFVPWIHELVFHLADPFARLRALSPGEPIVFDLSPAPAKKVNAILVTTPSGTTVRAMIEHATGRARIKLEDTSEPGIYRFALPEPSGPRHILITADGRESSAEALAPAEAVRLSEGWPLRFESDPSRLANRLYATGRRGPSEVWRYLVLAALGGLCLEVWMTRQLVRTRGVAEAVE